MDSHNLLENLTTSDNPLAGKLSIASLATALLSFASLATVFLSFAGFQGWIKFFLVGATFETCRRAHAWGSVIDSFWFTVDFEEGNRCFDWMLLWLSQHPKLETAGRFVVSDSAPGLKYAADDFRPKDGRNAHFLLAYRHVYTFWHKRWYIKAVRLKDNHNFKSLNISILGRSRRIANELLMEAKECWHKAREQRISIYASKGDGWRLAASNPKRLSGSIILDSGIEEDIVQDVRDFLVSKKWYLERGIPFRRGYLLYGAPGSGKTSLIQTIAGELNLDVYIISLSRTGLGDDTLRELITKLPERCIALMEDIDVAFHDTPNRDLSDKGKALTGTKGPEQPLLGRVSLSGLLNALDGVGAQEGRILFATTNRFESLDPALRRPGRMDYLVEFTLASQYQVGELFKKFYLPTPHTSTPQRPHSRDPATPEDEDRNRWSSNFGNGAPVEFETEKLVDIGPPTGVQDKPLSAIVRPIEQDVEVSPDQLDLLVERFRESIPEREFSMAELQGYLLMHKNRPHRAVECAKRWADEERAKRGSG